MIVSENVQRSPAWIADRLGIPTASAFHKIITPGGKLCEGKTVEKYLRELLIEWLFQRPYDDMQTQWMQRGNQLEDEARAWFEVGNGVRVVQCGLVWRDDKRCGASPDGFIGSVGSKDHIEIKVPNARDHLGYVLDGLDAEYRVQIQGQLWVCETERCKFVSYNPEIRPHEQTIERDEKYIGLLATAVGIFCDRLDTAKDRCLAMGLKPRKPTPPAPRVDFLDNRPLSDFVPPVMSEAELDARCEELLL